MKNEAVVVFVENEKILEKYFQIIADDFVTVRLIDMNRLQAPLFTIDKYNTQKRIFYSRRVMNAAFTVENICKFILGNE
jgi:hypothetical protein